MKDNYNLINREISRDLYLRRLLLGEILGPLTGKASIDRTWLQNYTEEQICYELPHLSIYQYLYQTNKNHLNDIALIYFGKKMSYGELFERIDKCASSFLRYGVKKGDIVTICMPNTPETVIAFYALNRIGAIANMIHPKSSQIGIERCLNEVKSKFLIAIDIIYPKIDKIINNTQVEKAIIVPVNESMPIHLKAAYEVTQASKYKSKIDFAKPKYESWKNFMKGKTLSKSVLDEVFTIDVKPEDLAVIFHTGGTTGGPKGVKITNDNYNSSITQIQIDNDIVSRGDILAAVMPMFHGFGSADCVHLALCSGVAVALFPEFHSKNFCKSVKKNHINHILGVPAIFEAMLNSSELENEALSYLKYLISGGGPLKRDLEENFKEFLEKHDVSEPLLKAFGLTEAVAATTRTRRDLNEIGSVGIPFVKNIYKVVKPGTTEELFYGEVGELCISGPSVMEGYYHNPQATDETLKVHPDGKIWLHTGDLGYIDQRGVIYYSQREKHMIITNGYNVYPTEIEEIIETHHLVKNCVVIGVEHSKKSEVAVANIVLTDDVPHLNMEQIKSEIIQLCEQNLPEYSIPVDIIIKDKIPLTLMNKEDRDQLVKEYKQLDDQKTVKIKIKK